MFYGKCIDMYYIGTDIEEVRRFKRLLETKPGLLQKIFSQSEWKYAFGKNTPQTLTGLWCAKEAVLKAFSPVVALEVTQIEITKNPKGYPEAIIHHPDVASINFHLSISISHTREIATATALLQVIE